jgi:aspartate/methionine/tyrosine aminotransferase
VCTTPGSAFGAECEGFLRISLASADADLVEGLGRLATYVRARATAAA